MLSRTSTSSSQSGSDHSKRSIQPLLPTDSEIIATAAARVYHLPFGGRSENWSYSGLSGTLVFGRNRTTIYADRKLGSGPGTSLDQVFWFRLIDPIKGLVWIHEIPSSFQYTLDKPFFHTFSGKSRMFGFRFDDDEEAATLFRKITSQLQVKASTPKKPKRFEQLASMTRRFTPSMVSPPATGTFVHLGHVGFNSRGQIEASDDMAPGWTMMLEELQGGYEVSKSLEGGDRDLMRGFPAGAKVPLLPTH
ncbi:hypothetical protein BC835DRAFT_859155 [Cytidiella melzeri]|nr:hypothetical protein BC835DRAFT_859155 [Cytidiella melzeri]